MDDDVPVTEPAGTPERAARTEPAATPDPAGPEPPGATPAPEVTTDAAAQIAALKAERDALLAEVDTEGRRRRWAGRLRTIGVGILVVLAVLCFIIANIGGWARRNLLDTGRFTDTAEQLIEDRDIKAAVGDRVTGQLVTVIDPENLFAEVLPERAQVLAVPLANAVERFLAEQVDRFVASDAFESVLVGAVEITHESAVRLLRGETENVQVEDGVVTINLLPIINAVLQQIEELVPEIFGRSVNLPEIGADDIPDAARERLSDALGVDLGDDFGIITIYDADALSTAQDALRLFERLVVLFAVLTVVFTALALWLSRRRRRTLIQLAVGAIIGLVVVRRLAFWFQDNLGTRQDNGVTRRAVHSAGEILLDSFFLLTAALLIALVIVALVAAVTGPYRWAVALRRHASGLTGQGNTWLRSQSVGTGPARWIVDHREALQIGGLIVGLLIVLFLDLSWLGLIVLALLVGIYELVVHQLGRDRPVEPEAVSPG